MKQTTHPSIEEHERISRRTVVKGGVSAAAVAVATLLSARESGAAVTSMDQVNALRSLLDSDGKVKPEK